MMDGPGRERATVLYAEMGALPFVNVGALPPRATAPSIHHSSCYIID